jgi:hypothetical protein
MRWRRKIARHAQMVEMESNDEEKTTMPETPYLESGRGKHGTDNTKDINELQ